MAGFIGYSIENMEKDKILDFRDSMETAFAAKLKEDNPELSVEDIVDFLGGANGLYYGYIDFIAWDIFSVVSTFASVCKDMPFEECCFSAFREKSSPVWLKMTESQDENDDK